MRPSHVQGSARPTRALITLAALLPLGLTFYTWHAAEQSLQEKRSAQFTALTRESEKALLYRVDSYQQALRGAAGFFLGSDQVTAGEWRTYVQALDVRKNYPGIHGLGWIAEVPSAQLDAFVRRMRTEGNPEFAIHPKGQYPANFVITFIEPFDINRPAIGLNVAFEHHRYSAAVLARDSGKPTITHHIRLVQDREQKPGFHLLLPLFREQAPMSTAEQRRAAFLGWMYAPFKAHDFLSGLTNSQGSTLRMQVYDEAQASDELIYDSHPNAAPALFSVTRTVSVGQKNWILRWDSTPQFEADTSRREPFLLLVAGLLFSALFAALIVYISRRTASAQSLARERTRQLHESEQRYQMIVNGVQDYAICMLDTDGRVKSWNSGAQRMLQYEASEILGEPYSRLHVEANRVSQVPQGSLLVADDCGTFTAEDWLLRKDGSQVWAGITINALRDASDAPAGYVAVIQDLTERREAERLKREFISTVSHELRTPLTSIRGSLGLMAAGVLGALPEKAQSMVQIALSNSERLVRIINDILDVERIETGKLQLQMAPLPVADFLAQALQVNEAYGEKFGVRFVLEPVAPGLEVFADQDRLMQVMANLLSNAAKFSPQGAEVQVRALEDHGCVRIEVQDHGTGIPDEFRARIFGKFAQADSSNTRRFDGTGLGLNITKRLIEAMNGQIGFTSMVGKGTTFRLDLPSAGTVTRTAKAMPPDAGRVRILHVEDDVDLAKVLSAALQSRDLEVTPAYTVQAAARLLQEEQFSLILLDPTLPDGSGFDLLDQIERNPAPRPPVIVLSAGETPLHIRRRVAAALVKSRVPEARIVETVIGLTKTSLASSDAAETVRT